MKRDRNSFFESSNYNMSAMNMPGMNGMPNMNTLSSNFYASQNMPMPIPNYGMNGMENTNLTELESRIAKIERNINRLDARLSKLEGNNFYSNNNPYDTDGNMYMV